MYHNFSLFYDSYCHVYSYKRKYIYIQTKPSNNVYKISILKISAMSTSLHKTGLRLRLVVGVLLPVQLSLNSPSTIN